MDCTDKICVTDMFKTGDDGELNDEAVRLLQKALYVEPLKRPLDLEKFPADGHEYIHRVRHEESLYFIQTEDDDDKCVSLVYTKDFCPPKETSEKMELSKWKRQEANFFSYIASELKSHKEFLKKKFIKQNFPSIQNDKECCLYCLGSQFCEQIYGTTYSKIIPGHLPLLSIVLHLSQEHISILLQYMNKWLKQIGINHDLCRWIYALLACLLKPLSDDCEEYLEDLYDECVKKSRVTNGDEKYQLNLISAILKSYFCIKSYKLGPSLEKFSKLC